MKSKFARWSIALIALVVLLSVAAVAFAGHPVRIALNGQEIEADIPATIINDRTMVPIRSIADIFGCEVQWDGETRTVNIVDPDRISKQFVSQLIEEQGEDTGYYFDGLHYELVNIDQDEDLEILARIDGGTNLGDFFIFDKTADGGYELIAEEAWKVESWDTDTGIQIGWNRVHELVTRTGGTGVGIISARLWYVEDGQYVELWRGTLEEWSTFQDQIYSKIAGYRVDRGDLSLYYWQTCQAYRIEEDDDVIPEGSAETTMTKYEFVGGRWVLPEAEEEADSCR